MAFGSVEPFGDDRIDVAAGIIASMIAETNRDPKKRADPFKPTEFMPKWAWEEDEEVATEQAPVSDASFRTKIAKVFFGMGGALMPKADK